MATSIHPTALVEPGAQLGLDCEIHPYAIIKRWAILGDRVSVHPFAVVGGDPQDLKFDGRSDSWVHIGSDTRIREHATVHRATQPGGTTTVGSSSLLMASCHVAHDCAVGNAVVIANAALLAGHVTVGDHAILGGASLYHQFVRVGEGVMAGGGSRFTLDLPPFTLLAERNEVVGLNLIGLKRRSTSREAIQELKTAFGKIYEGTGSPRELAAGVLAGGDFKSSEARRFLEFFSAGNRGFARLRRDSAGEDSEAA